jgi:hypothetical protein
MQQTLITQNYSLCDARNSRHKQKFYLKSFPQMSLERTPLRGWRNKMKNLFTEYKSLLLSPGENFGDSLTSLFLTRATTEHSATPSPTFLGLLRPLLPISFPVQRPNSPVRAKFIYWGAQPMARWAFRLTGVNKALPPFLSEPPYPFQDITPSIHLLFL